MKPQRAGPSPWQIQQAMAAANAVRSQLQAEDEADTTLLADVIDGETDAIDYVRQLVRLSIEQRAMAEAADARIRDITARRDRYRRRGEMARKGAFDMLDALGLPSVEDPEFTASIGRGRSSVVVTDPDALPDTLVRIKREPDKTAIKAALDSGAVVQGAELTNGAPVLNVRTK